MDCVSLGDPLCGWCVVEGKCSRRSSCKDSTVSERYLTQGNTDSCITSVSDPCQVIVDPGPCQGTYPRWFFNSSSQQCEHFLYGGCHGSSNRFGSLKECVDTCGKS